ADGSCSDHRGCGRWTLSSWRAVAISRCSESTSTTFSSDVPRSMPRYEDVMNERESALPFPSLLLSHQLVATARVPVVLPASDRPWRRLLPRPQDVAMVSGIEAAVGEVARFEDAPDQDQGGARHLGGAHVGGDGGERPADDLLVRPADPDGDHGRAV